MMAMIIGSGCTPPPVEVTEPASEPPSVTSPLALPTMSEPLSDISPPVRPTVVRVSSPMPVPPGETAVPIPAQAAKAVAWAQADLAARLNVANDRIAIVSVEFVQWRDSSLGCPQRGMMYLQVITPGYRILLQGGEKLYEYHSAQGRDRAVLCKSDFATDHDLPRTSLAPLPTPTSLERQDTVARAITDLAERLEVEPMTVEVIQVTNDEFPAQDLGCPSSKSAKESPVLPAFVIGQVIRLRVANAEYEYHAHGGQIAFCGQR